MTDDAKGAERRRFVRFTTWLDMRYAVADAAEVSSALTRNISGGGMGFFTKLRLTPGTVLKLEVKFPQRAEPVRCTAEVVWSGPLLLFGQDDAPHAYETGVRILEIAPQDQEFLIQHRPRP
ncbi:MAG: PilZ domain-containing protein [Candidatus Omnitrophica bacterium]|nr:PilZ domain-containing protein [Candidatus Omnitrophota bacterium]